MKVSIEFDTKSTDEQQIFQDVVNMLNHTKWINMGEFVRVEGTIARSLGVILHSSGEGFLSMKIACGEVVLRKIILDENCFPRSSFEVAISGFIPGEDIFMKTQEELDRWLSSFQTSNLLKLQISSEFFNGPAVLYHKS